MVKKIVESWKVDSSKPVVVENYDKVNIIKLPLSLNVSLSVCLCKEKRKIFFQ